MPNGQREYPVTLKFRDLTYKVLKGNRGYWRPQDRFGRPTVEASPLPLQVLLKPDRKQLDMLFDAMAQRATQFDAELIEVDSVNEDYRNTVKYHQAKPVDLILNIDAHDGLTVQCTFTFIYVTESNVRVHKVARF